MSSKELIKKQKAKDVKYKLLPPEGGWGYIITAALALVFNVTVVPMTAFGLIFGNFLQTIGDETTGTTLANGIFNTVFSFSGLAANSLLQKYTCRVVGLIGAFIFCIGSFFTVFVTNLVQLITFFGIVQGIGMGIMVPAVFTAFNSYFDKKLSLMNSIAQSIMVVFGMLTPAIGKILMDLYGFRGTVALLAAFSLNTFVAVATLQPVEWHMKKMPISNFKLLPIASSKEKLPRGSLGEDMVQLKPFLELILEEKGQKYISPRPRSSIISMGDRAMSVSTINRLEKSGTSSIWKSIVKSLDLGMFSDPIYVNISVGLSLAFTADIAFISIIPLILLNAGFDESQTTLLMTIYFGSDFAARILFLFASALCRIRNRYVLLVGSLLSAIFRTAFVLGNDFYWKIGTISILGFLRCFIQTPLPLVIADEYQHNFSTAFSLYMVVCGFVSLIFGPLMSFVKSFTQSDVMVVHLLSMAYLICSVTWIIELVCVRLKKHTEVVKKIQR